MTKYGPLDLLGTVGKGHDYAALLRNTLEIEVGGGLNVRVLELSTLIEIKQETAGDKDMAVLAVLRRTLEEKEKPKD